MRLQGQAVLDGGKHSPPQPIGEKTEAAGEKPGAAVEKAGPAAEKSELAVQKSESATQKSQPASDKSTSAVDEPKPKEKVEAEPGVRTFKVLVTNEATAATALVALPPTSSEGLTKLLYSITKSQLTPRKLPPFSDRSPAALTGNYATNAGSKTDVEPGEMDGNQWNTVLYNTRALTGCFFQWTDIHAKRPILVRAKKTGQSDYPTCALG
jgi:hypothetical protein